MASESAGTAGHGNHRRAIAMLAMTMTVTCTSSQSKREYAGVNNEAVSPGLIWCT
jgi:hypothetical protein